MTASADGLVAAIEPGLPPSAVRTRDVVLVTGPWLAGTTGVVEALRARMPERAIVEELGPADAPSAVIFVVSAVAPLTESDCALVDSAARSTELVIGVVSKIDAHRTWRDVLSADRTRLGAHAPRFAHVPWVGAAAAPDFGEPRIDELVGVLRQRLAEPDLRRRNRLRAWVTHVQAMMDRYCADGDGADQRARVAALHKDRDGIVRHRRQAKSEATIALRSHIQQGRVQLGHFARNRCTSVRAELAQDVAESGRRRLRGFESHARDRVAAVAAEVEQRITEHLADTAIQLRLPAAPAPAPPAPPEIGTPPLKSRRLETQLTMILGAGFGFGVALAVIRLFAGLAPGVTVGGLIAGGLVGLVLTVWVVGIRGLLRDRAVLDRWVGDAASALKSTLDERVATRVLAAESALSTAAAAREERETAGAEDRIAGIDVELREHAAQTARAAVIRDRRLPALRRVLDALRAELDGPSMRRERVDNAVSPAGKSAPAN